MIVEYNGNVAIDFINSDHLTSIPNKRFAANWAA